VTRENRGDRKVAYVYEVEIDEQARTHRDPATYPPLVQDGAHLHRARPIIAGASPR
jgi:hypothetical protein